MRRTHLNDQLVLARLEALEAVNARRQGAQVQPVDADLLQDLGLQLKRAGEQAEGG